MKFAERFLAEVEAIAQQLDINSIEKMAAELAALCERGGRLFVLGVGAARPMHRMPFTPADNILSKLELVGKNLLDYSLETVQMFHDDALLSGYQL